MCVTWLTERAAERRKVSLTNICICGHTPTSKQTSVSKSHKFPHISSSVWGTLTHSLTPYISGRQVSTIFYECVHTLHWSFEGSNMKGCLRERRKCSKQITKDIFLLFPTLYFHLLSQSLFISFPFLISSYFSFVLLSPYTHKSIQEKHLHSEKDIMKIS